MTTRPVPRLGARLAVAGLVLVVACGPDDPGATSDGASGPAATPPGTPIAAAGPETPGTEAAGTPDEASPAADDHAYPDVVEVELTRTGGAWSVAATISSPYDSPDRYADAFRVLAPDGRELGVRELLHDHANEQPFTRSLDGVTIPADVAEVTVEARDLANGWGGDTVTVPVPG